jgi:hypothetical protein
MGDVISFEYAPTLDRASLSPASFRIMEGPVNSGKSVWSLSEVYGYACTIPKCKDGIRRSKFLVVRDTYPNLESSTIVTWQQWFPENLYGKITGSEPKTHVLRFLDVECTIVFRAFSLDNIEKAIKDLRSTEWTGVWINEGQFFPLALVKELYSRTGRYPAKKDCPAYDRRKWAVMDMNAPSTEKFWGYYMRGKVTIPRDLTPEQRLEYQKPDDWEFFEQPAAVLEIRGDDDEFIRFDVNPEAENLPHIGEDSIRQELSGRSYNDVRRDLMNKVVPMQKGFPRYTQFQTRIHVADSIKPIESLPIIAGYDPGVHGCVHLFQQWSDRWLGLYTIQAQGEGAEQLAREVLTVLNSQFAFWKETGFTGWGDPYGAVRFGGGTSEIRQEDTHFAIMKAKGLLFRAPSPKDDPSLRRSLTIKLLKERTDTGAPRLLLDKRHCMPLINALDGGCTMVQVKSPDGMRVEEKVQKKNPLADVMEAAEYAFWGGGEGASLTRLPEGNKPKPKRYTGSSGSVFSNERRRIG